MKPIVITADRLWDGSGAAQLQHASLCVTGDRIAPFRCHFEFDRSLFFPLPPHIEQEIDPFRWEGHLYLARNTVLRRFPFPDRFTKMRNLKRERNGRRGQNQPNTRLCRWRSLGDIRRFLGAMGRQASQRPKDRKQRNHNQQNTQQRRSSHPLFSASTMVETLCFIMPS